MGRLLAVVIAVAIVVGGIFALTHKSTDNVTTTVPNSANSSKNSSSNKTPAAVSATGAVSIANMMFTPSQITVAKGGTVTWTNNDSTTHTVTADLANNGGPNSENIAPGKSYSFTFEKTGSFQYHCSIHPSMRGTIVVK